MSQHTKKQLIAIAIDRNIPYYRLTKAQLASKLNITITPKPPQTPQQKKDHRAAYAREYYFKNHDTIDQKACEYRTANPAKKRKWNLTYFDKQNRRTAIFRAHGVPYLTPGDPHPGDRRLWDRSTVPFARELAKVVATRSRAAPRSLAPLTTAGIPHFARELAKVVATRSRAAPRSLASDTGNTALCQSCSVTADQKARGEYRTCRHRHRHHHFGKGASEAQPASTTN
jgi:hypothetical protein